MADPASNSPVAYLREVRRARARLAHNPAALGQRLRQLNHARDLEAPTSPLPRPRVGVTPPGRTPRPADSHLTLDRGAPTPRRPEPPAVQHVDVRRRSTDHPGPIADAAVLTPHPQPAPRPTPPVGSSPVVTSPAQARPAAPVGPAGPRRSTHPGVLGVPRDVADAFVLEVEAAIEGGLLRYTARRRLLARAGRLGVSPFDANLLIASVLHHEARHPTATPIEPHRGGIGRWIVAVLAVEALAVLTWAIFG